MRICFCSDIHGNGVAWRAFLEDIKHQNADKIIFGGDIFGYYYDAEEILSDLRNMEIRCLLGNHDKYFLDLIDGKRCEEELVAKYGNSYLDVEDKISSRNIDYLISLSPSEEFAFDGLKIGFFHGGPDDSLDMRIYPDTDLSKIKSLQNYDFLFCGHTHHKMYRTINKTVIVNPGSIGQQRDGQGTSYVLFDTESRAITFHTFTYDVKKLISQIKVNENNIVMQQRLIEVLLRNNPKFEL